MLYLQWQVYKTLELIPDSVPLPKTPPNQRSAVGSLGKASIDTLSRDLSQEQQIEHLEKCLPLEIGAEQIQKAQSVPLRPASRLISLLKLLWQVSTRDLEPETWQLKNSYGEAWSWMTRP